MRESPAWHHLPDKARRILERLELEHMRHGGDSNAAGAEALTQFCRSFPDAFVVTERAPYYDPSSSAKGRLLSLSGGAME